MRVAADANVLLSAVVGGRAREVLRHPKIEAFTTAAVLAEVQEYLAYLARKRRLSLDSVLLAAASLPVTVIARAEFEDKIPEATRRIGQRDADDVELLALALHGRLAVWSNDNDFEDAGIAWHTTAQLLRRLKV